MAQGPVHPNKVVAQRQMHPSLRMHKPVKRKRSNRNRHSVVTASWLSSAPPPIPTPTLVMSSLYIHPRCPGGARRWHRMSIARIMGPLHKGCIRGGGGSEGGKRGGVGWDPLLPGSPCGPRRRRAKLFEAEILLAPKAPKQNFGCQPQTFEGEEEGGRTQVTERSTHARPGMHNMSEHPGGNL